MRRVRLDSPTGYLTVVLEDYGVEVRILNGTRGEDFGEKDEAGAHEIRFGDVMAFVPGHWLRTVEE